MIRFDMGCSKKPRILITGFGPFPGARFNPTQALVEHLAHVRSPAFAGVTRIPHIFTVAYAAVDQDLPRLIAEHRPHALLMFGLAARTPHVRVEMRARNAVSMLWPDASHKQVRRACIEPGMPAQTFGPHMHQLLAAAKRTGVPVRASRDAGRYLCNYLAWHGLAASRQPHGPHLAAFVHVPLIARTPYEHRMPAAQLECIGQVMLREMLRLVHKYRISDNSTA